MQRSIPKSRSPTRGCSVYENPLLKRPYCIPRCTDKDRKACTTRCIVTATSRNHNRCKLGIVGKSTYAPTTTRVKNSFRPLVRLDRLQGPFPLGPKPSPRQVRSIKTIRGLCTNENDTIIVSEEDNERVAAGTRKKSLHLAHSPMPLITVLATSRKRSTSPSTSKTQKRTVKKRAGSNEPTKLTENMGIENPQPQVMEDEQSVGQTAKRQSEPEAEEARKEKLSETKTECACKEPVIINCKCAEPKLVSAIPCPATMKPKCDESNNRNSIAKKIITSCEVTEAHYLSFDPPDLADLPSQGSTAPYCISHIMGIPQKQQPRRCKSNYDNLQAMRQSQCAGPWNKQRYTNSYGSCPMSSCMQQQKQLPTNSNFSQQQLQQQPMYQQQPIYQQQQPIYQQQQQPIYQQPQPIFQQQHPISQQQLQPIYQQQQQLQPIYQQQQQPMYPQQQQPTYKQQQQPMYLEQQTYQQQQEPMSEQLQQQRQQQREPMCQQLQQQRQQQQEKMCRQQQYQQLTEHLQHRQEKQPVCQNEQPTLTELLAEQLQQHMEVSQVEIPSCQSSLRPPALRCSFDNQVQCECSLTDETVAASSCECSCCGCLSTMAGENSQDKCNEAVESQRCQGDISEKCNVTFHESTFYNPHPGQTMAFTCCNMPTTESAPTADSLAANSTSDAFSRSAQPQQFHAQTQYPSQQTQNLYQLNMHPNNHYCQHQPCFWQRYAQMRFMMPRFWPCQ